MLHRFRQLDRRWVFLAMLVCVVVPILMGKTFPEYPTRMVNNVFDAVENLPNGSRILLAMDYEPTAEGELAPMAAAFVRHCIEKKHKMYFLTLFPLGTEMTAQIIDREIRGRGIPLVYGEDYVTLGYKPGYEGVIKVIVTDLRQMYPTDHYGANLDDIPMCREVRNVQDMDLVLSISAGYPGTKEWVQYAASPFPNIKMAAGCTGVQAPLFYPYVPNQVIGLLGAIKGAAEYEAALARRYPHWDKPEFNEALRRMAPQLWGHLLIVLLIIAGNIIYFGEKRKQARR